MNKRRRSVQVAVFSMVLLCGCSHGLPAFVAKYGTQVRTEGLVLPDPRNASRECPVGTHRVERDNGGDSYGVMEDFCAAKDQPPQGAFVHGEVWKTPPAHFRLLVGSLDHGVRTGTWSLLDGDRYWQGEYGPTGMLTRWTGHLGRTLVSGSYDEQGFMHGAWMLAAGTFTFEHGTGEIKGHEDDAFGMPFEGACRNGYRTGMWKLEYRSRVADVRDELVDRTDTSITAEVHYDNDGWLDGDAHGDVPLGSGRFTHGKLASWQGESRESCSQIERVRSGCIVSTRCHEPRATFGWKCEAYQNGVCVNILSEQTPLTECDRAGACSSWNEITHAWVDELSARAGGVTEPARCLLPYEAVEPPDTMIPVDY